MPCPSELPSLPPTEAIEAELLRRSLRRFVRAAWPVVEPTTPLVSGWCMDAIADHLEACWRREIRKLIINVPPGYMKSLLGAVMFPAWGWANDPSARWLFSSYSGTFALRDAVKCRRIVESEWYRARWGDRVQLASDQNAKGFYETTASGFRYSTGLSGSTGQRASFLVVDDPHDLQEVYSRPSREAVVEWWTGVMSQRMDDPKTAVRIVIMQRAHQGDLTGHLLSEEGDWEHLCLPARWEANHPTPARTTLHGGWTDPRTEEGELLWPERFGPEEVAKAERDLKSRKAPGQIQQRPGDEAGVFFKREWFQRCRVPPARFDELLQSWDLAFKGKDDSDYVVGGLWGRVGADLYLLDLVRDRMNFPDTVQAMRDKHADPLWGRARAKLVEDKANGPAVIATLQREIPGLIAVNPEGGKESRANAASPSFEAGNVWLPESAPWVGDYVEEMVTFPNASHDDQVDMTTQAVVRFTSRPKATTRSERVAPEGPVRHHARPNWNGYRGTAGAWRGH